MKVAHDLFKLTTPDENAGGPRFVGAVVATERDPPPRTAFSIILRIRLPSDIITSDQGSAAGAFCQSAGTRVGLLTCLHQTPTETVA